MVFVKKFLLIFILFLFVNFTYSANSDLVWKVDINLPVAEGSLQEIKGVYSDVSGVYVVGTVMQSNAGWYVGHRLFLQKYDTNGNLAWSKLGPNSLWTYIGGVKFDSTGIYVGSVISNSDGWQVQKYNLNNGNIVWSKHIDHSPGVEGGNSIHDLAIDATGVYVIGYGEPWLTGINRIKKFNKNNGNIIWEKTSTCGLNQVSTGQRIEVAPSGLFFTGTEPCYNAGKNYIEVRDTSNGNVIWRDPSKTIHTSSNFLFKGDDMYYGTSSNAVAWFIPPVWDLNLNKFNLNSKNVVWTSGKNFSRISDVIKTVIDDGTEVYAISGLGSFDEIRVLKFDTTSGEITFNYFDYRDLSNKILMDGADIEGDYLYVAGRNVIATNNYKWRVEKRDITKMNSDTTSSNPGLNIGLKYYGLSSTGGNLEFENNGAHSSSEDDFIDFIYSKDDNSYFVLEVMPGNISIKQGYGWKVAKYSNLNNNLIWKKEYFPPQTVGPPCFFLCPIIQYSANEMLFDNLTKSLYVVGTGSPNKDIKTWKMIKFNSDNGNVIWDKEYNTGNSGMFALINTAKEVDLYNNELYVGGFVFGSGWSIQKRNAATGNLISQSPVIGVDLFHDLIVDNSGVYLSGIRNTLGSDYEKWNLNLNTKIWQKTFPFNTVVVFSTHKDSNLNLDNSGLYIGTSTYFPNQWSVKKLNKNNGNVIWSDINSEATEGVIKKVGIDSATNSLLIFGDWGADYFSKLEARDLTTGSVKWEKVVDLKNADIYFDDGKGYLYDGSEIQSRFTSEETSLIGVPIAVELDHPLASPLKISDGSDIYAIILVDETDADATKWRIQTQSGVKALKKYTS